MQRVLVKTASGATGNESGFIGSLVSNRLRQFAVLCPSHSATQMKTSCECDKAIRVLLKNGIGYFGTLSLKTHFCLAYYYKLTYLGGWTNPVH